MLVLTLVRLPDDVTPAYWQATLVRKKELEKGGFPFLWFLMMACAYYMEQQVDTTRGTFIYELREPLGGYA